MSMILCFNIPTLLSFFRGSRRLANVNMLFLLIVSDSGTVTLPCLAGYSRILCEGLGQLVGYVPLRGDKLIPVEAS